jgi:hypothetical protein
MLPFTIDQFFGVFAAYNVAIWPVQIAAYVIAAMALWLIFAKRPWAGRVAAGVLALFWLWDGITYHLLFFSKINPAAYIFGAGFILQGVLFFAYGAVSDRLALRLERGWRGALGLALIIYAALVYEVVGHLSGHGWPRALVRRCTVSHRHIHLWRAPAVDTSCPCFSRCDPAGLGGH